MYKLHGEPQIYTHGGIYYASIRRWLRRCSTVPQRQRAHWSSHRVKSSSRRLAQITRKNFNSLCICSNFSYTKTEAPSGYYIRRESLFYCKFYSCFSYTLNRQFIRRKFSLHGSQCPTSYTCIRKTRAVPSFPARVLPQCCIRTTAAQFPNQSYPAVPVPARAESS